MSQNLLPLSAYTASAVLGATAVVYWIYSKMGRNTDASKRWSYTSHGMAVGAFPLKVNLPDPIINAVMLFKECPRSQEIVDQSVCKMLRYQRLNTVYNPVTGRGHPCENLDPQDLVRVIKVEASDQVALMKFVDQHMHHPLSEGSRGRSCPGGSF